MRKPLSVSKDMVREGEGWREGWDGVGGGVVGTIHGWMAWIGTVWTDPNQKSKGTFNFPKLFPKNVINKRKNLCI